MNLPAGGRIKRASKASRTPSKTIRFWNGASVEAVSPRRFPASAAAHPGVVAEVPTRAPVYDKSGFSASSTVFGLARRSFPGQRGAPRGGRQRPGLTRLMFFMQRHPPEESSIGPSKRALDFSPSAESRQTPCAYSQTRACWSSTYRNSRVPMSRACLESTRTGRRRSPRGRRSSFVRRMIDRARFPRLRLCLARTSTATQLRWPGQIL
jgi:hypothetical protein